MAVFAVNRLIAGSLSQLSLVFSALNLSTSEAVDFTMKIVGALTPRPSRLQRTHFISMATIVSTVALACTRSALKLNVHLHARYLDIVLHLRVSKSLFPLGWNTDFSPRCSLASRSRLRASIMTLFGGSSGPFSGKRSSSLYVRLQHPGLLQV